MNPSFLTPARLLKTGTLAVFCLMAIPQLAEAKGPKNFKQAKSHGSGNHDSGDNDRDRQSYSSRPRSTFTLSFGTGYAGSGYYYGPPNSPYYYERSDVRYYATREAAPREYYQNDGYSDRNYGYSGRSTDASVQRALSRRGYYQGSIDGAIGPQSRRAIVRYQRDNGLRATGYIDNSLLRSLDLR